jgi:hypothetical protein
MSFDIIGDPPLLGYVFLTSHKMTAASALGSDDAAATLSRMGTSGSENEWDWSRASSGRLDEASVVLERARGADPVQPRADRRSLTTLAPAPRRTLVPQPATRDTTWPTRRS